MTVFAAVIIDNRPGIEPIIAQFEEFLPKGCEVYWIKNEATTTAAEYNRLLCSKRLWRNLPAEKVLIFQSDAMLLKQGIEAFLDYDFIGAPLYHIPFPAMNGGLSLRDTKAMLRVINHISYDGSVNEDIFFTQGLQQLNGKLPDIETAKKFSVETIWGLGSLGYHAIDKWHSPEKCEQIRNQYK